MQPTRLPGLILSLPTASGVCVLQLLLSSAYVGPSLLRGVWNEEGVACVVAHSNLYWFMLSHQTQSALFVYFFSAISSGTHCWRFPGRTSGWGQWVCFQYNSPNLHLLLITSDQIIASRLHSYSLGNFALVLFCSVLIFSLSVGNICLEDGKADTEQIRLSGS